MTIRHASFTTDIIACNHTTHSYRPRLLRLPRPSRPPSVSARPKPRIECARAPQSVTPIHTSRASTPSTTADEPDVVDPVDESVLRASSRARRRARASSSSTRRRAKPLGIVPNDGPRTRTRTGRGRMTVDDAARVAFAFAVCKGYVVEVTKRDGSVVEGVFEERWERREGDGDDPYAWTKRDAGSDARAQRKKPEEKVTISFGDISCVRAKDVGMSDLAVGPSRAHDDFTDGGISRGATGQNRELVAWAPEEGDLAPAMTLEEEAAAGQGAKRASSATWGKKSGQWDQFSANKELFGVDTKFDESLYTTKLEKGKMGITEAEAARIAYEIQNQVSDNPHRRRSEDKEPTPITTKRKDTHPSCRPSRPLRKRRRGYRKDSELCRATRRQKAGRAEEGGETRRRVEIKLNPNAASFSLNAKAAAFVPSFKKPAAPQVPQSAPQMVMYPGYPQAQGQMMYVPQMPPQMRA